MSLSFAFLRNTLDSLTDHIAVLDQTGNILYVNRSWDRFGLANQCHADTPWIGDNYLSVCDRATRKGDKLSGKAAGGIRDVIQGLREVFELEYPCHSPNEKRWFMMRATPFFLRNQLRVVVSHQNITQRKIAEDAVLKLSRQDSLTQIANRRFFEEFLKQEIARCVRFHLPLSLALIDLDHFKSLNDGAGHQTGDLYLTLVARILKKYTKRPTDLCARYGGDEFALVYGGTDLVIASELVDAIKTEVTRLSRRKEFVAAKHPCTLSIGLATFQPKMQMRSRDLIAATDKLLYQAKHQGRDQVVAKVNC